MTGALLGLTVAGCQLLGLFLVGYLFRTDRKSRESNREE